VIPILILLWIATEWLILLGPDWLNQSVMRPNYD
jgi:hypothetical protein